MLLWCAGMLFGWEFVLNFILVSTVYAVAIGQPTFGEGLVLSRFLSHFKWPTWPQRRSASPETGLVHT